MAIRQGTMLNDNDGRIKYNWAGLLNADSGSVVGTVEHFADYMVQAAGTFGAAGSVALQGSMDGVNFFALKDAGGTVIALTTTEPIRISHVATFLKPVVTAGDGTTSLAVNLSGVLR